MIAQGLFDPFIVPAALFDPVMAPRGLLDRDLVGFLPRPVMPVVPKTGGVGGWGADIKDFWADAKPKKPEKTPDIERGFEMDEADLTDLLECFMDKLQ